MPKPATGSLTKSLPVSIARTQFGRILEHVSQRGHRFVVTVRGEDKAVILNIEDFLRVVAKTPKSLAALQAQAKKRGTDPAYPRKDQG
jgi:prevent-host-death family protein